MKIPTPVIDIALLAIPYLLGFTELKVTGNSLILNAIDQISFGEKTILYILTFLLVEVVDYKFSYGNFVEKTNSDLNRTNLELGFVKTQMESLQKKVELINHGQKIDKALNDVKHPYFVNLITKRLKQLVFRNNEIFSQTEHTFPSHAHTFGAKGLRTTKDNLKCVSYMPEYWEDKKDTEYMDTQDGLVKRGVKIQRLFIVNDKNRNVSFEQMKLQNDMGIETRYIEQSMVDADFKERDFLIQDDELLIDLYIEDDVKDGKHADSKELITTSEIDLLDRIEEFSTNWATAKNL